ncbi:hypothetical protein GLOIN_2v1845757 [Rhizophagus irregularis DAOM 181602=DAOM 197198]|uniref:Uncharacterized protein n=1 Tax=Rhizophagus irregularis (strain DAOM 181602 / DAOM 197198 / MUCL 43194) TaxID=747089 RepID=A0A2P4PE50_RHIID|nr:hypothetical protein GLOIN_2v1845757 [Rhizophagus irregularis DAOM 181602=DAOM 197198]POG63651.1 hypothetical protein GLOIN_2v1845757 [Rhizophagus irregularis DAOM 181602=DAOM 197198]|eukprot:XP_025170517.1 hypothetical protein GLOIN_2v1845757 [Rhizophagus irregularis DAOM 181602=DAOM 197198]
MRVFTLMLVLTLTLGFLTTAESYAIPKIFKNVLMYQRQWDKIGPFMEKQIPQYVKGAETFSGLKQLYGNALKTFRTGMSYGWRFKNIGLADALRTFDIAKIEQAVFRNLDKLSTNAVYRLSDKIDNALRYGEVTIEMIAYEMGVTAQVEGVSSIYTAIIGISEEEAVSVLAAFVFAE